MKALLETVGEMFVPKLNKWYSPEWKCGDYIALAIISLLIAAVIGLWPL